MEMVLMKGKKSGKVKSIGIVMSGRGVGMFKGGGWGG